MAKKQPLKGCTVAFCGNFHGRTQAALLSDAARLGANTSKTLAKNVTHLVATQNEVVKLSSKVQQAQAQATSIVSIDWMHDSEDAGAKQPESNYTFVALIIPTASSSSNVVVVDGDGDDDDDLPSPKNLKRPAPSTLAPDANAKKSKLDEVSEKARPLGSAQLAKGSSRIPLDDGLTSPKSVYVGPDGVIWDATLNQANAGKNNNKFYRLQLLSMNASNSEYKTWTRWGRVGNYGQDKYWGNGSLVDALLMFQDKFKAKTGLAWDDRAAAPKSGKYVFLERSYEPDNEENDQDDENGHEKRETPPCTLDPAVQDLMQVIFNQKYVAATMASMNYDAKKMPLGKLSKATIMRGFQTLKDLAARIDANSAGGNGGSVDELSNLFYSLIPHYFGRNRPPVINSYDLVKAEIELLETLVDLKDAADLMKPQIDELNRVHPLDRHFSGLGMKEMTPLGPSTQEFKRLETYLQTTRGCTHSVEYLVQNIFRIERQGEQDRFNQSKFSGAFRDRRLLWHGSRATNFGGILSQGLRIAPPEAPVSGYMFGKGVYLADMSSKSANYCYPEISGSTGLLLLCEAELGHPMRELLNADSNGAENAEKVGAWSTWGKGGMAPPKWEDAGSVHPSLKGVKMPSAKTPPRDTGVDSGLLYNEFICYDIAQIRLRYLFQVKMFDDFE